MKYIVLIGRNGSRGGHSVEITAGESIIVGRSWLSDVVINDPYVDGNHLKLILDTDNNFQVEDLNTKNGTRLAKKRVKGVEPYQLGQTISLGEVDISVVKAEAEVSPSLKYDAVQVAARVFQSSVWIIIAAALAFVGLYATEQFINVNEYSNKSLADSTIEFFATVFAWSLIAGFFGVLLRGRMLLNLHWIFVCVAFMLSVVATLVVDAIRFNVNSGLGNLIFDFGTRSAVIFVIAFGSFSLISRASTRKKLVTASLFAIVPIVMGVFIPMLTPAHEAWSPKSGVSHINQPPTLFVASTVSLDEHFSRTESLFEQARGEVEWSGPELTYPFEDLYNPTDVILFSNAE